MSFNSINVHYCQKFVQPSLEEAGGRDKRQPPVRVIWTIHCLRIANCSLWITYCRHKSELIYKALYVSEWVKVLPINSALLPNTPTSNLCSESAWYRKCMDIQFVRIYRIFIEVIRWRNFRPDNRHAVNRNSFYFINHGIKADKMRNLKLKISNAICLLPIISAILHART